MWNSPVQLPRAPPIIPQSSHHSFSWLTAGGSDSDRYNYDDYTRSVAKDGLLHLLLQNNQILSGEKKRKDPFIPASTHTCVEVAITNTCIKLPPIPAHFPNCPNRPIFCLGMGYCLCPFILHKFSTPACTSLITRDHSLNTLRPSFLTLYTGILGIEVCKQSAVNFLCVGMQLYDLGTYCSQYTFK